MQKITPFQDHSYPLGPFQDHLMAEITPFQDHLTIQDVWDIISLQNTFPKSFDTTGKMPGAYTICLDPSISPVQHVRREVPVECGEAIEKLLQEMDDQQIIPPVTKPTEWVSSLIYPQKPNVSLCICLDSRDFNKAIIWEHYKDLGWNHPQIEWSQCIF